MRNLLFAGSFSGPTLGNAALQLCDHHRYE
jgi:hypothetical protein